MHLKLLLTALLLVNLSCEAWSGAKLDITKTTKIIVVKTDEELMDEYARILREKAKRRLKEIEDSKSAMLFTSSTTITRMGP